MSALRALAWGMVRLHECTPDQRWLLCVDAKNEAHEYGYWISGCRQIGCCAQPPAEQTSNPYTYAYQNAAQKPAHRLTRWNKNTFRAHRQWSGGRRPGLADRNRPVAEGTFEECCKALLKIIEPSNPER